MNGGEKPVGAPLRMVYSALTVSKLSEKFSEKSTL